MPKINGLSYPDTFDQMASHKDKALIKTFEGYWPSQFTSFDNAFESKTGNVSGSNAHGLFDLAGYKNGKFKISLSAKDTAAINKLIDKRGPAATNSRNMVIIVKKMRELLTRTAMENALGPFYRSANFQEYHRKAVFDSIKPNKQVAQHLKINNMAAFKKFTFHMRMGETAEAQKVMEANTKAEEMKAKAPALVKKLMKMNF
ncbi:MAG: hypothetical protein AB8B85_15085 [Paracoccaceae bacterium]